MSAGTNPRGQPSSDLPQMEPIIPSILKGFVLSEFAQPQPTFDAEEIPSFICPETSVWTLTELRIYCSALFSKEDTPNVFLQK